MDVVLLLKSLIMGVVEGVTEFFAYLQHRSFDSGGRLDQFLA